MITRNFVVSFLYKYFFILKAAAEGWRITYIGGNQFQFYKTPVQPRFNKHPKTSLDFIKRYKCSLIADIGTFI